VLQGWVVIVVALGYIGLLFAVASFGDRTRPAAARTASRLWIYPLSLAVYCTSWTFFGSVGLASRNGLDFLTIYIGPIIMIGLLYPLLIRIVRLAKDQKSTSIADFIAARYGKNPAVAAAVALIALIGVVPYIALQLKAVSTSLGTMLAHAQASGALSETPVISDLSLIVTLAMAAFAVLFGTRHADATEHQNGLMLAIAAESIVKLVAFVAVGLFVVFIMFDGPAHLAQRAAEDARVTETLARGVDGGTWLVMTLLSFFAILLLPRQFHVTVVENNDEREIRRAAWLFPLYLVAINIFVVPIAIAGMLTFAPGSVDSDMVVLKLPLAAGAEWLALLVFIGGLSAATAMVIVDSVALAIMVSNGLVMPVWLKMRQVLAGAPDAQNWMLFESGAREPLHAPADMSRVLIGSRRFTIFAILLLAFIYYRAAADDQLASLGLLAFAAIAQLAPAFFGGLIWRRGTARGAISGLVAGTVTWAFTLLFPTILEGSATWMTVMREGLFGLGALKPQALFYLEFSPLAHGVFWSLLVNVVAYVVGSLMRPPTAVESLQANVFVQSDLTPIAPSFRLWRSSVTIAELEETVARYLGDERARQSFQSFALQRRASLDPKREADIHLLRYAELLLASAIGAASSRLVLSLLLRRRTVSTKAALKLLDDANAAIQYNREILQTALDHVRQGIAVFDKDLHLICWNRQFGEILNLPPELTRVGIGLDEILFTSAVNGALGPGDARKLVTDRLSRYAMAGAPFQERFDGSGRVVEVRANRMPDASIVTTFTDISDLVKAAEDLERANETLEKRVQARTEELTSTNHELARAKAQADEANMSKTRFLAAASHDILQPLNAARLYATSLNERPLTPDTAQLAANVDASLEAVEDILSTLLDISRLDSGAMKPALSNFRLDDVTRQLDLEFAPLARAKGIKLTFIHAAATIRSDRRLLRRLLQNLVSNAIKYTPSGKVLVGTRRRGAAVSIEVLDTGLGIPADKQATIFEEFRRLDQGARVARGLGLGLSIVDRIARLLGHPLTLTSQAGRGSRFAVVVPTAPAVAAERPAATPAATGDLTGLAVIVIDNEPSILTGMQALLDGWGCQAALCADPDAALKETARRGLAPDILLVDYHLNEGTGLEAIARLRASFGNDIPAVLITADRTLALREQAAAMDVRVLNKPLKPAALRALMSQARIRRNAAE
jgi:Na+/proline symporter/signal transduction histidine kinase/CheY-like chemotaxis protein